MSEQSGRNESSERPGSERSDTSRSGSERPGPARQWPATPASDMLSDLQRWLLRSSARNMRREFGEQVRRSFGGGRQQASPGEVWDTATNEIPPDVGESPECQWCPICRAARRMRDSGPGIGGQLSGAGDAVATVVQDAISAVDSILSRAHGGDQRVASGPRPAAEARAGSAADVPERDRAGGNPDEPGTGTSSGANREDGRAPAAGEHGPGGWKPGDRLATEHGADPDPWAGATESEDGVRDRPSGTDAGAPLGPGDAQLDGQGHGPDDRR